MTRRRFLCAAGAAAAGTGLYSGEVARHAIEVVHRTVAVRELPAAFDGFRIVQISDIHLEEFSEPVFLRHAIGMVNALRADLVLITGDFITHGPPRRRPERAIYVCAEELQGLRAPRLGVLGNHDAAVGGGFIARVLRERGTPVLVNQAVPVERGGRRLWVAGVEDPATSAPDLDLAIPPAVDGPVVLMAHAPDYADFVVGHARGRLVDLMLSGHSHGGQVRLPLLGPMILPPMGEKYVSGYFRVGGLQLYVNRGLGSVGLPFRMNCPPEISVLTLGAG